MQGNFNLPLLEGMVVFRSVGGLAVCRYFHRAPTSYINRARPGVCRFGTPFPVARCTCTRAVQTPRLHMCPPLAPLSVFTRPSLRLSRCLASGSSCTGTKAVQRFPTYPSGRMGRLADARKGHAASARNCNKTSAMMNVER